MDNRPDSPVDQTSLLTLFLIFLRLGLTSFGGPVAHLGYFRDEFVVRRKWYTEGDYADLVALCQFMPGPASSQVGLAIGFSRHRHLGALAAWAGFTVPSALALIVFALGVAQFGESWAPGILHGLKAVAVAVVAYAVWGMGRNLCPDAPRVTIMASAACIMLLASSIWSQVIIIMVAGAVGVWLFKPTQPTSGVSPAPSTMGLAPMWLGLFFGLLIALPLLAAVFPHQALALVDSFYRAGSLVFGGGHVVLPLLQAEVVPPGWVNTDTFLAGYGAAQAVPGPLFTFSAFLGASMQPSPSGWVGGTIALLAIFAPSFFLVFGVLPFWERLRRNRRIQAALIGVNSAVVGLLLAALYHPVWTSTIRQPEDFVLALVALVALAVWKLPAWSVVIAGGLGGWLLTLV